MASQRRQGREDSSKRTDLLNAAEQLMVEQGFSAVTSRRLAQRVDLSHQSVFYYFHSLDDLFIALVQRNSETFRNRLDAALKAEHPLRALWNLASDRQSAEIELEFKAMAVHNPKIREAMATNLEKYRGIAIEALSHTLRDTQTNPPISPPALALAIESIGRYLVLDDSLTLSMGHTQMRDAVEHLIQWFEAAGRPPDLS